MSWSIGFIGTPEKIIVELNKTSEGLDGQSKVEFDSALPNLIGIINDNFDSNGNQVVLKVQASGHGYASSEKQINRQCLVSVERFYGAILV
jgi:hypothetical protein